MHKLIEIDIVYSYTDIWPHFVFVNFKCTPISDSGVIFYYSYFMLQKLGHLTSAVLCNIAFKVHSNHKMSLDRVGVMLPVFDLVVDLLLTLLQITFRIWVKMGYFTWHCLSKYVF